MGRWVIHSITTAFDNTTAQIGILIAMAAVIGRCLLESDAAERIVRSILRVTGIEKSAIQESLMNGGVIILITAAGGAFGAMLQQTGLSVN